MVTGQCRNLHRQFPLYLCRMNAQGRDTGPPRSEIPGVRTVRFVRWVYFALRRRGLERLLFVSIIPPPLLRPCIVVSSLVNGHATASTWKMKAESLYSGSLWEQQARVRRKPCSASDGGLQGEEVRCKVRKRHGGTDAGYVGGGGTEARQSQQRNSICVSRDCGTHQTVSHR